LLRLLLFLFFVLRVPVTDRTSFCFQFAVGVVLEQVVSNEFEWVVGAGRTNFSQCSENSRSDRGIEISLGGQVVYIHLGPLGHGRELGRTTGISVGITTLGVEVGDLSRPVNPLLG